MNVGRHLKLLSVHTGGVSTFVDIFNLRTKLEACWSDKGSGNTGTRRTNWQTLSEKLLSNHN